MLKDLKKIYTALGLMILLVQGEEDIVKGRVTDQKVVFSRLKKKLKKKRLLKNASTFKV
jgi:hypothetical protein